MLDHSAALNLPLFSAVSNPLLILLSLFFISDIVFLSLKVSFESYYIFPFSHYVHAFLGILMHMYNICNSYFKILPTNFLTSVISVLFYQLTLPTLFAMGPVFPLLCKPDNFWQDTGYSEVFGFLMLGMLLASSG